MKNAVNNKLSFSLFVAVWLAFVCFALNYSALAGNWRWDDSSVLLHLHKYSIFDSFLNPDIWREFSRTNLMPWLIFSYEIDLNIFGLNPNLFYFHQLLALTAASIALYFVQSLWVRKGFAALGATLFLLSAPSVTVALQLMTRHYIEGLLFCLLALLFFVRYLRSENRLFLVASVAFYALSVVSKELYVPLLILLPCLPESTFRKRIMAAIPFFVVALTYVFWRNSMLGSLTGGYTESGIYLSSSFLPEVLTSFANFPFLLFGPIWPLFVITYMFLVATYLFFTRSKMLLTGLVVLLVLLPLVPLVRSPGILNADRYLLLFWVVTCFSISFFSDKVFTNMAIGKNRTIAFAACWPLFLAVAFLNAKTVQNEIAVVASEYDEQASFIWNNTSELSFEPSASLKASFWFIPSLIEFKERLTSGISSPLAVPDDIYLNDIVDRFYKYDVNCNCMQDISNSIPERRSNFAQNLRSDAPLAVEFQYKSTIFNWQFGPYVDGEYQIVSNTLGVATAPPSGQLGATLQDGASIFISYTSPEGWKTYSDELRIVHNSPTVTWQRQ